MSIGLAGHGVDPWTRSDTFKLVARVEAKRRFCVDA